MHLYQLTGHSADKDTQANKYFVPLLKAPQDKKLIMRKITFVFIFFFTFISCKKDKKNEQPPITNAPTFQPELPAYYNLFNRTNGWIGADVSSSIPLSSQKTLWLYGDTWNGTIEDNKRKNYTFTAHNTIAIQDGTDPSAATLNYYFGSTPSTTFFIPNDNIGMLWPMHGTMINSELYIFFVQSDTATGGFGFKLVNSKLIKISNPLAHPSQWLMTQYQVPHSFFSPTKQIVFGSNLIQKDGYTYIYGTETDNTISNRYLLLSRVKSDSITNFSSWKFYSQGQWKSDYQISDRLTSKMGFEFSISFQPQKNKFVLVNCDLGFSQGINIQYADSLWGNWTTPVSIYQCPEPAWGNKIFCYAAKGHPELSANNELIITYVANSTDVNDIINDARLYWPRFIKVPF